MRDIEVNGDSWYMRLASWLFSTPSDTCQMLRQILATLGIVAYMTIAPFAPLLAYFLGGSVALAFVIALPSYIILSIFGGRIVADSDLYQRGVQARREIKKALCKEEREALYVEFAKESKPSAIRVAFEAFHNKTCRKVKVRYG